MSLKLNYRVNIYNLNGALLLSGVTIDKDAATHVTDKLNHNSRDFKASIHVEATNKIMLPNGVNIGS